MSIDIKKVNEDFVLSDYTKQIAINFKWQQDYPTLWTLIEASCDKIYATIHEKVANYVQNIRDIDFCNLHALNSLAHEMGQQSIFSYDLAFPPELERLMSILSVSKNYMPEVQRLLLTSTVESLCAGYMASTSIPTFSGWNVFGSNSMFDNSLSAFNSITGESTVTKNWSTLPSISGEILNDIVLEDATFLMSTGVDFISEILNAHLYAHTRDIDLLTTCGIVIPPNAVTEEAIYAALNYKQEVVYDKWKSANQYVGFLDDIWPEQDPYRKASYTSSTSADMITTATSILKDMCVKASYLRDTLKSVTKKYSMIGTANSIEDNIAELIRRSFTKQQGLTNWRFDPLPASKYEVDSGFYSATKDVSSQALIETFGPSLSGIGGLTVEVIEHYDKTEYMNIRSITPNVTGVLSYTTTYATSSWIDFNGIYQSTVVQVAVPTPVDTGAPSIQGGNLQYWMPEFVKYYKSTSQYTSAQLHEYFVNVGFNAEQLSAADMWLISGDSIVDESTTSGLFLPSIWSTFAASGYTNPPSMADLSGVPAPNYIGVDPLLIPSNGWIIPPVDITVLQSKFIGTSAGDYPPLNYKNQQYPTVASQPFIWNLVEKSYALAPTINESPLWSTITEVSGDLRDSFGKILNSWKYNAHELHGYNTYYENSLNLNYQQVEDSRVDIDGPYKEDALMVYASQQSLIALTGFYDQLARYSLQFDDVSARTHYKNFDPYDRVYRQLSNWRTEVRDLSGQCPFENKNIQNIDPALHNYSGGVITAFDGDVYDNQYTLFKKDSVAYETPGVLWMRMRSHPIAFPAMSGVIQNVTTSGEALDILNSFGYAYDAVEVISGDFTAGHKYAKCVVTRPEDGFEVASWHPKTYGGNNCENNPYYDTLVIYDYMLMNLCDPYSVDGIEQMFSKCYDFFIDGSEIVLIGQALSGISGTMTNVLQDKIAVLTVESKTINTMVSGESATDDVFFVTANSIITPKSILLGDVGIGILKYVGHFFTSDMINFVVFDNWIASTIKFNVYKYNRVTYKFDKNPYVVEVSTVPEPKNSGCQFVLSESKDLISIGYLNDDETHVTTIDFNKNEIVKSKSLAMTWELP